MELERSIFVVGASAGGVEALTSLVSQLPANFAGSVFVVLHLSPDYRSQLPEILQRSSRLPVRRPHDGEAILPGEWSKAKELIAKAHEYLREGDKPAAQECLERALVLEPNNAEAMVGLSSIVVFKEPQRAVELANAAARIDPSKIMNGRAIDVLVTLLQKRESVDDLEDDPAKEPYVEALNKLGEGDLDGTLSALVESVRRNRAYNNEAARLACIALFNVLGPRSETAKRHQRALEMALF